MTLARSSTHLDTNRHPIGAESYIAECRERLDNDGALVLAGFARAATIEEIVVQSAPRESDAYYTGKTHNVYLTPSDPLLDGGHPFNRQVESSKGLYADDMSSINVHFAAEGMELGWHFDNSSFAVTMLLQAAEGGAHFEHVPAVRDADAGDMAFERVGKVLDGGEPVQTLDFEPGDLVLFRGRNAIHRVTPTEGGTTRLLVVFAYNDQPGVALSESALTTFYGRTA